MKHCRTSLSVRDYGPITIRFRIKACDLNKEFHDFGLVVYILKTIPFEAIYVLSHPVFYNAKILLTYLLSYLLTCLLTHSTQQSPS